MKIFVRVLVFAALVAGLAYLYRATLGVDAAQRERVGAMLRELKQLDAEWDVQVLRSKTGLSSDYDPLTRPQVAALRVLETTGGRLASVDHRLSDAEAQLRQALASKVDLVDRFKAQNAILRNSLRFAPLAAQDLKAKAREAAEANPGKRAEMAALAENVDLVLIDALKLEATRDSEANPVLKKRLSTMVERRGEYPASVATSFDTFINHVTTIAVQKDRESELLEQLGKIPVAARIEAVDRGFTTAFERMYGKQEKYRLIMYAYAAFLLVLLAFLIGRGTGRREEPQAA